MRGWWIREGASVRLAILIFIGVMALSNWVIQLFQSVPIWPFEWYQSSNGPIVYYVHDRALRDDVPTGSLWVLMNDLPVQDPVETTRRIRQLRPGDPVSLKFWYRQRWINVQWTVPSPSWFPKVWVGLTGALLWIVAFWLHFRYSVRRFYRRMWVAVLSLAMIYLFHPVGRWDGVDIGFWILDRLGFAVAPIALIYWAAGWKFMPVWRSLHRLRRWIPPAWLALHLALIGGVVLGGIQPWSLLFLRISHALLWADWWVLISALSAVAFLALRLVPRVYGTERNQFQILAIALLTAVLPSILASVPLMTTGGATLWNTVSVLTHPVLPVGFFLSVHRRRWDIEYLFKRSLVYVPLAFLLVVFYITLFGTTMSLVSGDLWVQLIILAVFATVPGLLIYPPLIQWFVRLVDRFYLGQRYSALEELQRRLRQEARVDRIDVWMRPVLVLAERALDCIWVGAFVQIPNETGHGEGLWIQHPPPMPELQVLWADNRGNGPFGTASGRLVRPGIVRHPYGSFLAYEVICTTDEGPEATLWFVWSYTDHWLGRDELNLLEQIRAYVQHGLHNYSLLLEAERQNRILEELRRFHQAVFETLDAGILVTDRAHPQRILMANRTLAQWLQTTPEAMRYQEIEQCFPHDFVERVHAFFEHPVGSLPVLRIYLTLPETQPRLLQVSRFPMQIPMEIQTVEGFLYVMEDITHLHQLEQQLLQTEKLSSIGLLAAGIAHEINTPLTGIVSYAQVLSHRVRDGRARHLLNRMQEQIEQIKQTVQTFLDMAQPRRQTARVVEMRHVVEQGLRLLRPVLKDASVRIHLELTEAPTYVWGHEAQLHQVLANLVVNARDAMPQGGDIYIRLRRDDHAVILEVEDTGVGMDEMTRRRIFDPFFTTKAHQGGTGLGLTIAYHIVRQHGGTITVHSEPGRGSRFQVVFPAWSEGVGRETYRKVTAG